MIHNKNHHHIVPVSPKGLEDLELGIAQIQYRLMVQQVHSHDNPFQHFTYISLVVQDTPLLSRILPLLFDHFVNLTQIALCFTEAVTFSSLAPLPGHHTPAFFQLQTLLVYQDSASSSFDLLANSFAANRSLLKRTFPSIKTLLLQQNTETVSKVSSPSTSLPSLLSHPCQLALYQLLNSLWPSIHYLRFRVLHTTPQTAIFWMWLKAYRLANPTKALSLSEVTFNHFTASAPEFTRPFPSPV